jgi:hypothetical protein
MLRPDPILERLLPNEPVHIEYRPPRTDDETFAMIAAKRCIRSQDTDSIRSQDTDNIPSSTNEQKQPVFIVIGIVEGADSIPLERYMRIRHPKMLFWRLWIDIVKLRGLYYALSLKDVKEFRLYRVGKCKQVIERDLA